TGSTRILRRHLRMMWVIAFPFLQSSHDRLNIVNDVNFCIGLSLSLTHSLTLFLFKCDPLWPHLWPPSAVTMSWRKKNKFERKIEKTKKKLSHKSKRSTISMMIEFLLRPAEPQQQRVEYSCGNQHQWQQQQQQQQLQLEQRQRPMYARDSEADEQKS